MLRLTFRGGEWCKKLIKLEKIAPNNDDTKEKMTLLQLSKTATATLLVVSCYCAHATDVFRLEGYGPISRAMGGAATAFDVGPAGMMTNPATLSLMAKGNEIQLGLDGIFADINTRNQASQENASSDSHSKNRGPYFAPEAAYTHREGAFTFGIGAFAQGGLGTEYGKDSFLSKTTSGANSGLDNSSRLLVLNIPIAVSYDVTEKLSIGGSLDAMWTGLNLDLLLGANQVGSLIGAGRASGSLVPVLGGLPAFDGAHISFRKTVPSQAVRTHGESAVNLD
ncbi:OmpP1/FadL family transporter [Undibacterium arcticum]|uniref:OmpP1/FadL family transporter n=1 Tax=Undibacterium arcticum TaxID=1762892 RepID=UPI0036145E15